MCRKKQSNAIREYLIKNINWVDFKIIELKYSTRLIQNNNGLTTIQLLQQHHQEGLTQNSIESPAATSSLSLPFHHLHLTKSSLKISEVTTKAEQQSDDEMMMPTDLRKGYA